MKRSASFAIILLILFLSRGAYAACSVTTTAINFVSYDVFNAAPLNSTGGVTVSCVATTTNETISIGPGQNGTISQRQMKLSVGADLLNYNLYTDVGRTQIWGDGTTGATVSTGTIAKNKSKTFTIYGSIPPNQDVSVGSYSDTLVVTITP